MNNDANIMTASTGMLIAFAALHFALPANSSVSSNGLDLSDCMNRTTRHLSSAFPNPTYDELRARALLKAGHAKESIEWFLKALPSCRLEMQRQYLEVECGKAYEKVGMDDDAITHFKNAGTYVGGKERTVLLLKRKQFAEALKTCDEAIKDAHEREKKYHHPSYDRELAEWLGLRCAAKEGLNRDTEALADLYEATKYYGQDSSDRLEQLTSRFTELIKRQSAQKKFQLTASSLPSEGKTLALNLLKFLGKSTREISLPMLNQVIGTDLKVPGGIFPNCDQKEQVGGAFWQVEYRTNKQLNPKTGLLEIIMWTTRTAIPKRTVMKIMPTSNRIKTPVYSVFNNEPIQNAEAWSFDHGILVLTFERSGFQVLSHIEWRADGLHACEEQPNSDRKRELAEQAEHENKLDLALREVTTAISLELTADKPSPTDLTRCFLQRAEIHAKQNNLDSAIADAASAVKYGGNECLQKKIDYYLQAGKNDAAIAELKSTIQSSQFERERSLLGLRLGKILLTQKDYKQAIAISNIVIESESSDDYARREQQPEYMLRWFEETERMTAPALLIKAKAEEALGDLSTARRDAELASQAFFAIAKIECRDKILEWASTL